MIRDRLVCGVKDARIQRRLLQEPDITFDKALSLARAMETAALDAEEMHRTTGEGVEEVMHKTQESKGTPTKSKCSRCLAIYHTYQAVVTL